MAETDKDDLLSIIEDEDKDIDIPHTLPLLPVRDEHERGRSGHHLARRRGDVRSLSSSMQRAA